LLLVVASNLTAEHGQGIWELVECRTSAQKLPKQQSTLPAFITSAVSEIA
jgi:hypothetical protein